MRPEKTNVKQAPVQISTAFVYETGGRDALIDDICRDMVSSEVIPKSTRAAEELLSIQKETQDTITSMQVGT